MAFFQWRIVGTCWVVYAVLAQSPPTLRADSVDKDLASKRAQLQAGFSRKMKEVAATCEELGLKQQAATTRRWEAAKCSSVRIPCPTPSRVPRGLHQR